MPEAPVHEDARPILPQHQVRVSWQPPMVQPVAKATSSKPPPNYHLRLRVPRPYGRHVGMPLFCSESVHNCKNTKKKGMNKIIFEKLAVIRISARHGTNSRVRWCFYHPCHQKGLATVVKNISDGGEFDAPRLQI